MKILIIKLSSLGDVVHAIPTVNAIAKLYPEAHIDWLIYSKFSEIILSQSTINIIHKLDNKKLSTLIHVIQKLQKENYDLVIDLQGLMKTAIIARSISSNVIGFKEPREKLAALLYKTKVDAGDVMDDSMHVIERNLAIAKFLVSGERSTVNGSFGIDFGELTKLKMKNLNRKICLIPCTTWQTKHWPVGSWVELMQQLKTKSLFEKSPDARHASFEDTELTETSMSSPRNEHNNADGALRIGSSEIYILGTLNDLQKIEAIICKVRVPFHLVVNKTLSELPEFFSEMDIVIGVDTGPLHIAAAALYGSNAQVIGLYGPSSGARTGPYGFQHISGAGVHAKHKRKGDESMSLIKVEEISVEL